MTSFNSSQLKAIQQTDGPLIITAGPGTGKTTVLIHKLLELIKNRIPVDKILTLTFTKKAAQEIKDRIIDTKIPTLPWVGTFHSLGYEICSYVDRKAIKLISEKERKEIIKNSTQSLKIFPKIPYREISLRLSRYKQEKLFAHSRELEIEKLYQHYSDQLEQKSLNDYDDILINAYVSLKKKTYKKLYTHILIDEFQDTNQLQYAMIKELNRTNNICVIGDPLQSIYTFQGATPNIFDIFKNDFPLHNEITLDTNYRSQKHIIQTSKGLFPHESIPTSYSDKKGRVSIIKTLDIYAEAHFIVNDIHHKIGAYTLNEINETSQPRNISFKDIAILYRTHHLSRQIKKNLSKAGIPFQIIGGGSIYEEPEIQTIINLILSSSDEQKKLSKLIKEIIEKSFPDNNTNEEKYVNLKMFESLVFRFDTLKALQEYLNKLKDYEYLDTQSDLITLSTIHAAKGLEFRHVYICGFNENEMPYMHIKKTSVDEERRLLYVGLTRAKEDLTLTYSQNISPFFSEINHPNILHENDPFSEKLLRQRHKNKVKKSQLKLF